MSILRKALFLVFLCHFIFAQSPQIIRGPYLQRVTPTSGIVRWRTDVPSSSLVVYGEKLSDQKAKVNLPELVTEHSVILDHLRPNKKYYYSIGDGKTMSLPSENRYLKTVPALGSKEQVRIWALGDFGSGSANQKAVLKSMVDFTSKKRPDAWIWLGDNAYSNGKEEEYQARVFDIYQNDFFQNTALYPAPGNHDYAGKHDPALPPYFKIFTMPFNGEVGGLPSGAPSYYSVNVGQVHLVSIDTELTEPSGNQVMDGKGLQYEWLERDLKTNKLPWVIVYFHKPPYSKGSHDSDNESDMKRMRENVNPLFEKFRVDLVLAGHSHVYERTHPMRGHHGINSTFDANKHVFEKMKAPNHYLVGKEGQGVIYIVNGSGGQLGGQKAEWPLKSSVYSNNKEGGSMIFDIDKHRFEAHWVSSTGDVKDHFIIEK
jgi:hypothetical protein